MHQGGNRWHYSPPCLHDHVGRYFKQDVKREKDGQTSRVFGRCQAKVIGKSKQLSISNVGSVQEREQVQESKPWDNSNVTVEKTRPLFSTLRLGRSPSCHGDDSPFPHDGLFIDITEVQGERTWDLVNLHDINVTLFILFVDVACRRVSHGDGCLDASL